MADLLKIYLSQAGRRPFLWGECDCYLFMADWIERVAGVDPAGKYRGCYTSAREARNVIRDNGGPVALADRLLHASGFRPTESPALGDVGLVRAALTVGRRTALLPVGAIMVRERCWAIKTVGTSLAIGEFPLLQAWRIARDG